MFFELNLETASHNFARRLNDWIIIIYVQTLLFSTNEVSSNLPVLDIVTVTPGNLLAEHSLFWIFELYCHLINRHTGV